MSTNTVVDTHQFKPTGQSQIDAPAIPLKIGILAFPQFFGLDAFGPLELLNIVADKTPGMTLSVISTNTSNHTTSLEPVPTHITNPTSGPLTAMLPTFSIDDDPELDVLLIPGGRGTRTVCNDPRILDYIKRTYPKLKYLLSVCTGAIVIAKTGLLDGKPATTNKYAWNEMVALAPQVDWIPRARWVVSDNIWTASGVSAGMDLTHAFITHVIGQGDSTLADFAANYIEYVPHTDSTYDPFCDIWKATIPITPRT